jgi:hypothetical protein
MTSEPQLVKQKPAALAISVSVATLRRMGQCGGARVELASPSGGKPLVRYDLRALRLWWALQQGDSSLARVPRAS